MASPRQHGPTLVVESTKDALVQLFSREVGTQPKEVARIVAICIVLRQIHAYHTVCFATRDDCVIVCRQHSQISRVQAGMSNDCGESVRGFKAVARPLREASSTATAVYDDMTIYFAGSVNERLQ